MIIQWTPTEQLEDLDFADDVYLISATYNQMKWKTEKLIVNASKFGMNVNIPKAKVLKVNGEVNSPISLGGEDIGLVEKFCHLGSVISTDGGTDKDISVRPGVQQRPSTKSCKFLSTSVSDTSWDSAG